MAWIGALAPPTWSLPLPRSHAAGITAANGLGELIWYSYLWAGAEPGVSVADAGFS
jgi:hypothetical protein